MKKILLTLILLLLFATSVQATQVKIADLEYEEKDFVVIEGNVTLIFSNSTNYNDNDVQVLKILYDSTYDLTLYRIESKNITYDAYFINNTKYYYYTSSGDTYFITVDYSSIQVPDSPLKTLMNLLEEKNQTLNLTIEKLNNMTSNYTESVGLIEDLSDDVDHFENQKQELETEVAELLAYRAEIIPILEDYHVLENESNNKTIQIASLLGDISDHQTIARAKNQTIKDLENPFCLFYSKAGPSGDTVSLFHVNLTWTIIGIIIILFLIFVLSSKNIDFGKTKTLLDKQREKGKNLFTKMKEVKPEKKKEVDWNEDIPEIEKQILKPPKKNEESVESEVDKIIESRARKDIDNMFG